MQRYSFKIICFLLILMTENCWYWENTGSLNSEKCNITYSEKNPLKFSDGATEIKLDYDACRLKFREDNTLMFPAGSVEVYLDIQLGYKDNFSFGFDKPKAESLTFDLLIDDVKSEGNFEIIHMIESNGSTLKSKAEGEYVSELEGKKNSMTGILELEEKLIVELFPEKISFKYDSIPDNFENSEITLSGNFKITGKTKIETDNL